MIRPVASLHSTGTHFPAAVTKMPKQAASAKTVHQGLLSMRMEQAIAHAKKRKLGADRGVAELASVGQGATKCSVSGAKKDRKDVLIGFALPLERSAVAEQVMVADQAQMPSAVAGSRGIEVRTEQLAARIENACKTGMSDPSRQGDVWRYTLLNDVALPAGIHGIEVALSGLALDVVLLRENATVHAAYLAAAQQLADALQKRFGSRVVRVHEASEARIIDARHVPKLMAKRRVAR